MRGGIWIMAVGWLVPQALTTPALAAEGVLAAVPPAGAVISRVTVMPVEGQTEVRIEGRGVLVPTVKKDAEEGKIILDFPGVSYQAPGIILNAPGLGDLKAVRGGQNKGFARVVVEVPSTVAVEQASAAGRFVLSLATKAVAGPEEAVTVPAASPPSTAAVPAATVSAEASPASAGSDAAPGARARVLHAMIEDLPDRVRLVVTADGVLRYKMASQADGRELILSLFDVDLKWSPARLAVKDGPIQDVQASETATPSQMVRVAIKLRQIRPYHIRRDQNQVVVEVDKEAESEEAAADVASRGGDLMHRVTLNVQNEDLTSLVKALAFEAGFDNVVANITLSMPVTISLREVPLAKALNLILAPQNYVWKVERGVLRVALQTQFESELNASALSGAEGAGESGDDEGGVSTRVFRLKYVSVFDIGGTPALSGIQVVGSSMPLYVQTDLVNAITQMLILRTRGRVIVDSRSNSLIVTDASSNMSKIARLIRELDVPLPQVHILARLVQISHSSIDQFGVNWSAEKATPANPTLKATALGYAIPQTNRQFDLVTGFLGPGFNLDANLKLLQTRGDAQLILNPSITTVHDRPAIVSSTDSRSFAQTTIVPIGQQGFPQTTFQQVSIPIQLVVRPHVNPDKTVVLEVDITMTAITKEYTTGPPPDTTAQHATTRLLVRNRETGVIGGMLTDSKRKSVEKVPLLGDLPWFLGGALFRTESTTIDKVELVLFLTPTIAEDI
ncbi:MAG: secretin N-terminal domain-containing protein [Candidatus Coatesbacteria bacterium]